MNDYYIRNEELAVELNSLIDKHGFIQVLFILENLASENAEFIGEHWEKIRKNLENSLLEIEEHSIINQPN